MDWGWVPIVVALIAGPVMFMLHRFERRNDAQHAENGEVLSSIKQVVLEQSADIRDVKADVRDLKSDHRVLRSELDTIGGELRQHLGGDRV
jgi:hypothetical protein